MAVPQRTLSWLYSVLSKDRFDPKQTYHDPTRAYHDVANALAQYPSLSPRTDVYTYENGISALLLHLVGTLPVTFRGTTYRFPIAVWIPNTYPRDPPMVYVTPTQDMVVRMGQHVTLEGRVYHHYLAHWPEAWDKSTLVDLLYILREVFAKEPPVQSRKPVSSPPQPQQTQSPPPLPPLPPSLNSSASPTQSQPPASTQIPPQLPPKPGLDDGPQRLGSQTLDRYLSPPPLPPLPPKQHGHGQAAGTIPMAVTGPGSRSAPLQTPLQHPAVQPLLPPLPGNGVYNNRGSIGQIDAVIDSHKNFDSRPPAPYTYQQHPALQQSPTSASPSQHQAYQPQPSQQPQPPGPPYPQHSPYPTGYQRPPPAVPASVPKTETPDLLTSPFELELPSFTPGPAPPIPPNPEKDALLHAVSTALAETLHNHAAQSDTAAQSLVLQSHSLQAAMAKLQGEVATLNSLKSSLQSNTAILQQSIHRADATIADAQARSSSAQTSGVQSTSTATPSSDSLSGLPPIDEVLVAPTVVGKQLYDLVAEEQGLQHALYALQAALVRGVIGVDSWSRHTRGLAREAFLKRALVRKIGRGMGLEETVS